MILKLWKHLTRRRRMHFFSILALMIIASIMEVVSIGAIVPFLGALTSPEKIFQHTITQPLIQTFEITKPSQLLLPLTILFVAATLLA